jgi:hypothetical protein
MIIFARSLLNADIANGINALNLPDPHPFFTNFKFFKFKDAIAALVFSQKHSLDWTTSLD